MNHAPASVAAAIAVTASAAVSAGLAAPRVCEGFAMVPDVKVISSGESVLACAPRPVEAAAITAECFVGSMTGGSGSPLNGTSAAADMGVAGRSHSSHRRPISSGILRQLRVDPPSPPAIFRRLRDLLGLPAE